MNLILNQHLVSAKIVDIFWERINLYIDLEIEFSQNADKEIPLDFYAVNENFLAKAKFKTTILESGNYRLYLNITNPGYNRCLPKGEYYISVCQGENEVAHCMTDELIVKKMADFSRSFLYGNRGKSYSVVFFVDDSDDSALPFKMQTLAASETSIGNINAISLAPSEKVNNTYISRLLAKFKKKIKKSFGKDTLRKILRRIYKLLLLFHRSSKNTILFMSEQNSSITANQEAIYNRMIERGLDKEYKMLKSFRFAAAESKNIFSWLSLLNKLAKSTMVIIDDHAPVFDWLVLNKKKTKVVQLWHAGAGFKSSGYSRWGNTGCPSTFCCHRQYSYGIAGSKNIAHFFSEVWGINTEQVLPTGMPRMDEYLNEDYKNKTVQKLYKQYPLCKGKKVILFAPTYRGKNKAEAYYPYELINFEKFYELCGDEYVVLFKMHPWVATRVPIEDKYKDKFVDVGLYPNINDLFYITDLLITDYSSNIFEYSLMKNPMLFFAFDEIQYSFSRGFHRDYELSAPGKIVHTFDDLLTAIENKDFEVEKVQKYVDEHFDYIDSNASDRVIDWIILGNIPKDMDKAIHNRFKEVKDMAKLNFANEQ